MPLPAAVNNHRPLSNGPWKCQVCGAIKRAHMMYRLPPAKNARRLIVCEPCHKAWLKAKTGE